MQLMSPKHISHIMGSLILDKQSEAWQELVFKVVAKAWAIIVEGFRINLFRVVESFALQFKNRVQLSLANQACWKRIVETSGLLPVLNSQIRVV